MARDNVTFKGNSVNVMVATTKVSENFTNAVKVVKIPTTDASPNTAGVINLNKVEKRWTVSGYITNGKMDSSDTYTLAIDKKNGLTTMFGLGAVISLNWEGSDKSVTVDKYDINFIPLDDADTEQEDIAIYTFMISAVEGEDMI